MDLSCVAGGPLGKLFSLHLYLVLLVLLLATLLTNGQPQGTYDWSRLLHDTVCNAVGVSLMFLGATTPNDSFVDLDDVLNIGGGALLSNNNPRALVCLTDLVDCCAAPRTVHGDWYFPDGTTVGFVGGDSRFLANRGVNDGTNLGSVRLFRRYGSPPGRGHFRCELPNVANPSVNQIINVKHL